MFKSTIKELIKTALGRSFIVNMGILILLLLFAFKITFLKDILDEKIYYIILCCIGVGSIYILFMQIMKGKLLLKENNVSSNKVKVIIVNSKDE